MGKQYGYYGVILDVLDKILDGDYMVRVMCEDGSVNRICAPMNQFRLEDLKRGTVIIYTKSYYWNLVYLNTDIEKYKYSKGDLLKKGFIDGIKWTPEEIKIIDDDSFTRRTMNYLFDMSEEDRELWFDKFVDRNTPDAIAKTCDENGEMLWEYYALEVDPRKLKNNLLYL